MQIDRQSIAYTKPEWQVSGGERQQWYTFLFSPLWLCLLVALGIRVFLIIHTHGVIEGDEALVGIQAENILRGTFPVYFYNQPYMGSLEAYLAAGLFALFGPSVWALRMVGTLLSLALVWLTWRLAGALAESVKLSQPVRLTFMSVAALCAAIPPLYDGVMELHMLGGYIETFVLMLLLLLSAFQLTRRWRAGISYRELGLRWLGIGFIVGLGLWVDPLITSAVFTTVIWILGNCLLEMRQRKRGGPNILGPWWQPARELLFAFAAVPSCLLGMAPALGWGATHQWANLTYVLKLGGHFMSQQTIENTLHGTQTFGTCVAPRLVGGALPLEGSLPLALHTSLFFIGLASLAGAGLLLLWVCVRPHSRLAPVRQLAGLPALFAFCCVCSFCLSPASLQELQGCGNDWVGRYATPVSLAFPFLFAAVFTLAWFYLRSKERAVSTASRSLASPGRKHRFSLVYNLIVFSQSLILILFVGFLGTQAFTYKLTSSGRTYQSNYCTVDPFDNGPILAYLQKHHVHYIWGNNFLVYPLVFKSDLSIIGSDPLSLTFPAVPSDHFPFYTGSIDRIPSYTNTVLHADRPTMLFVIPHDDRQPQILQALDKLHVTYRVARFYGQPGYDVLVVTPISRTVSPLELKQINIFICVTS
jgi:hypothetical protein